MSQGQPRRPESDQDPVRYGDVFDVQGNLATKPIAPRDAASMQSAENQVLGETQITGPAAVMQSAATVNVRRGAVSPYDVTDVVRDQGVTVTEANIGSTRIVTERVGAEVVGQFVDTRVPVDAYPAGSDMDITIGEALEATAYSAAGDKPIDQSDAAAIKAAEVRALRSNETPLGGIGAQAQSAADINARVMRDEDKTTLSDVLSDATAQLPADRAVRREDAEGVISAEIRNKPDMRTTPGGVAASMAAAARLNQNP
ncbi:late embryogenesis abundant protein D-34 [Ricinus communis]|uniref:Late embryogenesis abundant protein D-34, putative n=1 Tax=Ricinus communis TaxID=3988 RepID=B9S3Z7_RICCO|nr:late embryogenesis abundant protein D-34 [Ricinus communis]EEF41678.1 Late embryogenesis abundant protein D-34, putative [Ricinus communis]|eukprot:XP_002520716.1 late embryogenesis abundant protein D-34 [Ricinus communis]